MWYSILLYFSASHSLIGSQQGNQRYECHHRLKILVVKYKGYIAGKNISLPSSTRPTIKPSQLFGILLYSCSFILWPYRKTVSRLYSRSWSKTKWPISFGPQSTFNQGGTSVGFGDNNLIFHKSALFRCSFQNEVFLLCKRGKHLVRFWAGITAC